MVVVRPARPSDEARLHELDLATWSPQSSPGAAPAADEPFFQGRRGPGEVLVAEDDGTVVGFAVLLPPTAMPSHQHVRLLNGLGVAAEARGAGVGTALVAAGIGHARAEGARKLTLRVLSTNASALQLYQRLGFVVEGRLVAEYRLDGQDVDDVLMALHLDDDGPAPAG